MSKIKKMTILVGIVVITTLILALPKAYEWTSKDTEDFGNGNGNGDNGGSFTGEATIKLLDAKGQVLEANVFTWLQGQVYHGGLSEPTGCDEGEHWDQLYGCVPDEEDTTPDPPVTEIPEDIPGDATKIQFTLDWAEVQAVYVQQESLRIEMRTSALTGDIGWCVLSYPGKTLTFSDFSFETIDENTWKARTKTSHTMILDITDTLQYWWLVTPLSFRFIYQAKGQSISAEPVKSNRIIKEVILGDITPSMKVTGT